MERQVIHIYGASGSGTSTIGKFIRDKLGYFFMDTDDYFWEPASPPLFTLAVRVETDTAKFINSSRSRRLAGLGLDLLEKPYKEALG